MNRKGVTAPLSCQYSANKAQLLKLLDLPAIPLRVLLKNRQHRQQHLYVVVHLLV